MSRGTNLEGHDRVLLSSDWDYDYSTPAHNYDKTIAVADKCLETSLANRVLLPLNLLKLNRVVTVTYREIEYPEDTEYWKQADCEPESGPRMQGRELARAIVNEHESKLTSGDTI